MRALLTACLSLLIGAGCSCSPAPTNGQLPPPVRVAETSAAADTSLSRSIQPPVGEELPLLEMLFRDAISRFGTGIHSPDGRAPVFLATGTVGGGQALDPPAEIFERLADLQLNLRPWSSAEWDPKQMMYRDSVSGMYGSVMGVRVVRWITPTEADVRCSRFTAPLGGKGYSATAHKTDAGWELPRRINCWVS
jgi:hypothetical protein